MSDKSIHGNRALRVTPRGQRAIGAPVTIQITVEVEKIRAVLDAASDALMTVAKANPATVTDYEARLAPAISDVRLVVEAKAREAGVDDVRTIR